MGEGKYSSVYKYISESSEYKGIELALKKTNTKDETKYHEAYIAELLKKKNVDCQLIPIRRVLRTEKESIYIMIKADMNLFEWCDGKQLKDIVPYLHFIFKSIYYQIMCIFETSKYEFVYAELNPHNVLLLLMKNKNLKLFF